jgi:hypothetical protein
MIGWVINPIIDPTFWVFILIIAGLYRRTVAAQREMYGGRVKHSLLDLVTTSLLFGIIAGLFGNIIVTTVGIAFGSQMCLVYVFFLSLLLLLINPRYICFSYSGGILSLVVLISAAAANRGINFPIINFINSLSFDVTSMMAIVGILHLIESILMWMDGGRGAVPVFMRKGKKVVGAFVMQRFWIIPVLFIVIAAQTANVGQIFTTPVWWPFIKPASPDTISMNTIFATMPLLGMLGYGDIAVTSTVHKKVNRSAVRLLAFSIILLILSVISSKIYAFKYIAALFAPLAHEALILFERKKENEGLPYYEYQEDGIVVLDTIPGTAADSMGMKPGEKIVNINNIRVNSIEDAEKILGEFPSFIWVEVEDKEKNRRVLEHKNYVEGVRGLGIITIPRDIEGVPYVEEQQGLLIRSIKKLFKK